MRYIKENSYDIVRLYVNQIGITIFSAFLYLAVGMMGDDVFFGLKIAVSVFSSLFYVCLVHNILWEIGATDKIRIDSGKVSPTPAKGFVLSLIANVPNFLLALLAVIFSLLMMFGVDWAVSAFGVVFLILRFHTAMYMGMIQGSVPAGGLTVDNVDCLVESILFLVIPMVAVGLAHLSYWLGTKEIKLLGFLDPKKKSEKN